MRWRLIRRPLPRFCSPARRRPRRYGTGEQADGKLPDYGPGRQAGICAAIWACGCTLRCSQGRWYLKGTAPLSEHQPGGSQCRGADLPTYDTGCDPAIEAVNASHAGAGYLSRADTRTLPGAMERLAAVQ
jgi:hypothetical protein